MCALCLGKPDLFITMTCNPNWDEIQQNLLPGQKPWQRPDLIARVFEQKLKRLLKEIVVRQRFGRVVAHICVVEFQKRGLPHAHILVVLAREYKPMTADLFDKFTCAEILAKDNVVLRKKVSL